MVSVPLQPHTSDHPALWNPRQPKWMGDSRGIKKQWLLMSKGHDLVLCFLKHTSGTVGQCGLHTWGQRRVPLG